MTNNELLQHLKEALDTSGTEMRVYAPSPSISISYAAMARRGVGGIWYSARSYLGPHANDKRPFVLVNVEGELRLVIALCEGTVTSWNVLARTVVDICDVANADKLSGDAPVAAFTHNNRKLLVFLA